MRKFFTGTLILALSLITTTCDITGGDETSPCGSNKLWTLIFNSEEGWPWQSSTWNVFTEGNNRVFQIASPLIDNVCPDEHIIVNFDGYFSLGTTRITHARIKYRYSIYGGEFIESKTIGQDKDMFRFPGDSNFGIKQAYNNIPGSFWVYFEWIMADYQDPDVDLAYFRSTFVSCGFALSWKEFASK